MSILKDRKVEMLHLAHSLLSLVLIKKETRFLIIYIYTYLIQGKSDDLSPRTHIVDIVKKANQRIGMVRRCFTNLTGKKIKTLYTTMIRPVLEYGANVIHFLIFLNNYLL